MTPQPLQLLSLMLLVLLLLPGAVACTSASDVRAEGRFLRWDIESGEVLAWPAMQVDASCMASLPGAAFDGETLAWVDHGRLRLGDRAGGVTSPSSAEGTVLTKNGSAILLVANGPGLRSLRLLDLETGLMEPRRWPATEEVAVGAYESRLAWVERERTPGSAPTLWVQDVSRGLAILTNRTMVSLVFEDDQWPDRASVSDMGRRWIVGVGTSGSSGFAWAYDLQEDRFLRFTGQSGAGEALTLSLVRPFLAVDGDTAYAESEGELWRRPLPGAAWEPIGPLPSVEGRVPWPIDVRNGIAVLGDAHFPRSIPGVSLPAMVGLIALASVAMACRPPPSLSRRRKCRRPGK